MKPFPTPRQLTLARQQGKAITIGLPSGRQILLAEYVRSWRKLLTLPTDRQVDRWSHFPVSVSEILRDIRKGIHDRINRHLPWYDSGRKWSENYQTETYRAAIQLNQPRLRIYWLPDWLKPRFAHRIADRSQD